MKLDVHSKLARPARQARAPDALAWLDALPLAVIGVDAQLIVQFANATAGQIASSVGRSWVGAPLAALFGGDSPVLGLVANAAEERKTFAMPAVKLVEAYASLGAMDLSISPVDARFTAVCLTPRGRAETAVETRPVSAMARKLAHEIRNPLAGIRAAAQLIGRGADGETQTLTSLICDEVDRIRRLTDRIDALEGLAPPNLAPVNVHVALDRVRAVLQSSFTDVRFEARYDPSLPTIEADLDQLIQAILNIAKNGAEAARAQPDAHVVLSTAFRPGVRVRAAAGAAARPQLEIGVEDNGPGLPPATHNRIFEPFMTTKAGGMGLGLSIAAEIVTRHEGRIEAESAPGRTKFKIFLPI